MEAEEMSGGGGNQTTSTQSIPGWLQSAGQGYLQNAQSVAQQPYTPYTLQRVADLSPIQRQSIQGLGDLAGGTGAMNDAEDMLSQTLRGQYGNPYAQQGAGAGGQYGFSPVSPGGQYGFDPLSGGSQYGFDPTSAGQNQYEGENPYFRSSMQSGLSDIADAYERGTSADTTRMMNLAGVLGGGANQRAVANNERNLADRMGNYTNSMLQGQFDRSAQLAESGLNRGLQSQQFNVATGGQAFENFQNRGLQAGQFNRNLGSSAFENAAQRGIGTGQFNASLGNTAFENAAQRGLNAGQFNANLGSQGWENERNRQMQAASGAGGLATTRGGLLQGALNAGDMERRSMQQLLDSQYGDFNEWRGYPEHQLGVFGNAVSAIMGRGAGSTTTTQGPPRDPVAQGLGAWQLMNAMGGGNDPKGGGGNNLDGVNVWDN